jgi:hypothetical protein
MMQIDKEIDTRGLNCPLPILKAKKALTDMHSGQLLKVSPPTAARCATSRPFPGRPATSWSSSRPWATSSSTCCAAAEGMQGMGSEPAARVVLRNAVGDEAVLSAHGAQLLSWRPPGKASRST